MKSLLLSLSLRYAMDASVIATLPGHNGRTCLLEWHNSALSQEVN